MSGATRHVRFGRFVLNHERGCLQDQNGADLFLRPKSFLLLTVLVGQAVLFFITNPFATGSVLMLEGGSTLI